MKPMLLQMPLEQPPLDRLAPLGTSSRVELRCSTCSYGVVVRRPPPRCPMCGVASWEHTAAERRLLTPA